MWKSKFSQKKTQVAMQTVYVTFEIVFTCRGGRKDGYVVTQIYRIHKLPFFLTRGATLPLLRVRQSSAMNIGHENISGIIIIFFN